MTDLWGFLLQTLTASGAAVLLLVVKAMFRDKLPPRWQFAAWGVLGLVLLPAGLGGRYALLNWPCPPGRWWTTRSFSMANGGKNIQRRIESIARFKRYPAGMALVSACAAVTLADHPDGPGDLDRGQGLAGRAVGLCFSSLGGGVHRRGPVPDGGAVRAAEILPGGPAVTGGKKLKKRGCKSMLLQPRFFNCFIAGWTRRNFINRQSYVA